VLERPDELGGSASVRLRVPHGTQVDDVALRAVRDGEPRVLSRRARRGDRDRDLVSRNLHGRQPEHALPLASRRRQRRLRLGERSGPDPVRRGGRGRLRPHDRSRRAGVAPRLCRLRDLPRPLCPRPVGGVLRPCGRRGRGCGATSSPRSSAATSGARRSGSRGSAGWRTEKPAPADEEEELPTLSELAEMLVGK
jgi:hypothetical protein